MDPMRHEEALEFQFPSNGKVYPKYNVEVIEYDSLFDLVSIPFKRESISKVKCA